MDTAIQSERNDKKRENQRRKNADCLAKLFFNRKGEINAKKQRVVQTDGALCVIHAPLTGKSKEGEKNEEKELNGNGDRNRSCNRKAVLKARRAYRFYKGRREGRQ